MIDIKKEIGLRILAARKEKGLTRSALGTLTDDLKPSRISNWERGERTPGPEEIKQLAKALDISSSYLMCLSDEKFLQRASSIGASVPLLDHEIACNPQKIIQLIKDGQVEKKFNFIPIAEELKTHLGENTFALKIKDDSMNPELRLKDIIIIDPDHKFSPGSLIVVKLQNENEVLVRRFKQLALSKEFNCFELCAENDNWGNLKIEKADDCRLIGAVRCIVRYLDLDFS